MPFQCPTCGADIPLRHVGVALYTCPSCHATCELAEGGLAPGELRATLLQPNGEKPSGLPTARAIPCTRCGGPLSV